MKRAVVRRLPAVFAVLVLTTMVAGAYVLGSVIDQQQRVAAELERRSAAQASVLCESQNETRLVLGRLLDSLLSSPRPDDAPGEFEERLRLRESVDEFVRPQPCPTPPKE